jgi:hypothetical protein
VLCRFNAGAVVHIIHLPAPAASAILCSAIFRTQLLTWLLDPPAVMYFYVTWYSETDTAMWFRNNVGRNCADPARADYAQYCGELIKLCKDLRNLTAGVNATAAAGIDKMLSAEAGIPVAAMCESFTGEARCTCARWLVQMLEGEHEAGVLAVWRC